MKKKILIVVTAALFPFLPSYSQSNESESSVLSSQQRPTMPILFFRPDERRVLEALRQGVVEEEALDLDIFVPVVITDTAIPDNIDITAERVQEIEINSFIRNRSKGIQTFWINGREVTSDELAGSFNEREGLEFEVDSEGGVVSGIDALVGSEFEVKVGQIILENGQIEESLPVVRKSNN